MDARVAVNQLLGELGARLGRPTLALSANGTCGFDYQDQIQVVIELPEHSALVHIYAPVMGVPERGKEQLFGTLLRLNLFCCDTKGATFAIDENRSAVILCYSHPVASLDQILFETILENFLATLERWHGELTRRDDTPEPAERAHAGSLPPGTFLKV